MRARTGLWEPRAGNDPGPPSRRRPWILLAQTLMSITIAAMIAIPSLIEAIGLLAAMVLIHNVFGSLQDVSVDALAVDLLDESERGRVNGLMYGSSYFGTMLGGAGLGWILGEFGLRTALFTQVGLLLAIMSLPLLLRERAGDSLLPSFRRPVDKGSASSTTAAKRESVFVNLFRAMTLRSTLLAALLALGTRLGSAALDTIGLEYYISHLNWTKQDYNSLMGGYAVIVGLTGAMSAGFIADRVGAKRLAAVTTTLVGVLWIVFAIAHPSWPVRGVVMTMLLLQEFLLSMLLVSLFALFMTISWPRVAATQFTAYMALLNLSTTCGSWLAGDIETAFGITTAFWVLGVFQVSLLVFLPGSTHMKRGVFWARVETLVTQVSNVRVRIRTPRTPAARNRTVCFPQAAALSLTPAAKCRWHDDCDCQIVVESVRFALNFLPRSCHEAVPLCMCLSGASGRSQQTVGRRLETGARDADERRW